MKEQNNIDPLIGYHSIVMNSRYRFMPVVANMDKAQILYFPVAHLILDLPTLV